ncbi:MAG: hypothetical protein KME12_14545 [Trichocoleus desertorum ATA4-8-CV12]|nr:hypothetical protein [Trichocoleus desertorum ATA4-8-CV12]
MLILLSKPQKFCPHSSCSVSTSKDQAQNDQGGSGDRCYAVFEACL